MPHFQKAIAAWIVAAGMVFLGAPSRSFAGSGSSAGSAGSCGVSDSLPIRSISFEGLNTTREHIVQRELGHRPGMAFSCAEWELERTRLEDLDIFSEIRIKTESGRLTYLFRELPPYIPFVTVAVTDQDGFSAGPGLASLNFLGYDIRTEAIARFGGTTEFQASISSPWLGGLPVEYDLAAIRVDSYNHIERFHEDSWRVKLELAHRLGRKSQFLYNGEFFRLRAEKVDTAVRKVTLDPEGDIIPRLGGGYLWDGRDRRHNPRRGLYQEFRVTQSGGFLGGDADYSEWLSDTRVYLPWSWRNVLFLGALYQYRTGETGQTFPIYDQFHAGGANTLRGFGNDAYRGRNECIATLENRVDLVRKRGFKLWNWGGYYGLLGVAGVEAASLWGHHALMEGGFHAGTYAGLHLVSAGIDKIRLELGSNTAKLDIQITLGILEKADVQRFRAR